MAGFTTEALEKRLLDLNNSQQSIQTLSLWLLHHRKHNAAIVQTWFKELKKAKQNRKLTFMYLANDVIQNSRKKGPEFTKEFSNVLRSAFENVTKEADDKTWSGLDRILTIWKERGIYDAEQINQFRSAIGNRKKTNEVINKKEELNSKGKEMRRNDLNKLKRSDKREKDRREINKDANDAKKRKLTDKSSISSSTLKESNSLSKNDTSVNKISQNKSSSNLSKIINNSVNGDSYVDTDQLVKSLQLLENSASCDAVVREKIANLPPEVSDISLLENIRDKDQAEKLSNQVEEACILLNEYNNRLSKELDDRKQISIMLSNFIKNQKDILTVTEEKLANFKEKLRKMLQIKNELQSHLQNLPDLSLLPSVTGGLAPLPSAGDLFNIAAARNNQLNQNKSDIENKFSNNNDNNSTNTSPAEYETVSALTPSSNEESSHQIT